MFAKTTDKEYRRIETRLLGYTADDLSRYLATPYNYQTELINISNHFYRGSGFYQKIIDLFAKTALNYWTVDTSVINNNFYKVKQDKLQKDYQAFCGAVDRLKIEKQLAEAFIRVLVEDACYGYWVETNDDAYIYWLPSTWCEPRKQLNDVIIYGILPTRVPPLDRARLPDEIQKVLTQPVTADDPYVYPPPEKCFCLKWNSTLTYAYPPLISLLSDIIDVEDFKQLLKSKTESENYNLLGFDIPLDATHQDAMMLTEKVVAPVVNAARRVVPTNIGIVASPMKLQPVQWKSSGVAERNNVSDSITSLYDEAGIPKEIMSSASNGAELKAAITNFSSGIYAIYRQIEMAVNLKMMIQGFIYPSYRFVYRILDVTQFNKDEYADHELKIAQFATPNKMTLLASMGINPARMFGNEYMENFVLKTGSNWTVLKSSHTSTTEEVIGVKSAGRPTNESQVVPLTEEGQASVDSGANDPTQRA